MNKLSKYKSDRNLTPHSNFSFEYICWEYWNSATVANSLFNGSIFENCIFEGIVFNDADLEGTKFSNCEFIKCSFENADIRSAWVAKTNFQFVTFSGAMLVDSSFLECRFDSCGLDNLTQAKCLFEGCTLDPFQPQNSSITSSCYKNTSFNNATFKNVFYYHRFENCQITDSTFEAYLLGFIYGITLENLKNCRIAVMGKIEYPPNDFNEFIQDVFCRIKQVYNDRKLFLNIGILELSDCTKSKDEIVLKCIELMYLLLKKDLLLKNEEITFFGNIVNYIYGIKEIAPITIFLMERKLAQTIEDLSCNTISNIAWEKAKNELKILRNSFYFLFLEFTRTLGISPVDERETITLQVTYEKQPEIPFVEILAAMMPGYRQPVQVRTEIGSFIEYIETVSAALPYINTFLTLIGVIVPIVSEIRATKREKKKESLNPSMDGINCTIPAIYLSPGIAADAQNEVASVIKIIVEYHIVTDKHKKGYSQSNIKRIKVVSKS